MNLDMFDDRNGFDGARHQFVTKQRPASTPAHLVAPSSVRRPVEDLARTHPSTAPQTFGRRSDRDRRAPSTSCWTGTRHLPPVGLTEPFGQPHVISRPQVARLFEERPATYWLRRSVESRDRRPARSRHTARDRSCKIATGQASAMSGRFGEEGTVRQGSRPERPRDGARRARRSRIPFSAESPPQLAASPGRSCDRRSVT